MSDESLEGKRIVLTGGAGFLGSHVVEQLHARNADDIFVVRSKEYDLRDPGACAAVVKSADIVIHAAGNVGGIGYNMERPGELFYDNAIMGIQLIEAARRANVAKLVVLGTVCAYPKLTPTPFREENLWDGYPEETNASYGLAKKMLLVQAQAYRQQYGFNAIYLVPVNLYGPRDHFGPRSHVIPAEIRKVYQARQEEQREIPVWGKGTASREFLYVGDAAEGIVLATLRYDKPDPVNLGTGHEITIRDLAHLICKLMDYDGRLVWEPSKPGGQPRRALDTTRAAGEFGFRAKTSLEDGLKRTIKWFEHEAPRRGLHT
jgi:GDP-L-fucose synthase